MPTTGFRLLSKVFVGTVAVILLTGAIFHLRVVAVVEEEFLREVDLRLRGEAELVASAAARALSPAGQLADLEAVRAVAERVPGTRVTLVGPEGRVLYESEADRKLMENHLRRPEIERAGEVVERESQTVRQRMRYLALEVRRDGALLGYARVAVDAADARAGLARVRGAIGSAVVLACAIGLVLAFLFARRAIRPLREIGHVVGELGRGEIGRRIPVTSRDEIGELARSVNTMADLLQERLSRIARDQREKDVILSGMSEGLIAVDRSQHVVLLNDAARRMLDLGGRDARGRAIWEITQVPEVTDTIQSCLEEDRSKSAEVTIPRNEHARKLQLVASPLSDRKEGPWGCALVLHDVTELRRLEAVRRDFVANVSHELKTPLTAMRGYLETILDDPEMDPRVRDGFLEKAKASTDRLGAIVGDLLSLARIESEDGHARLERVDLAELAADCVSDARASAEERAKIIALESTSERLDVDADVEMLATAIHNLIGNAIKYAPEESSIRVRTGRDGDRVWVEVEDEGPGIAPADQERIFERFYRVDKNRSRALGGTGLGLSIVRHVVAAHGGEVRLRSELGRGSRFRLLLPAADRAG